MCLQLVSLCALHDRSKHRLIVRVDPYRGMKANSSFKKNIELPGRKEVRNSAKQDSAKNVRPYARTYAQKVTVNTTQKLLSPCVGSMTHCLSEKHLCLSAKQEKPQGLRKHDSGLRVKSKLTF